MNSPSTPAPGFPQKGDIIAGKYQVEDVLGQGGVGVVVAARHLALRQRVAVKFLLPTGLRMPGAIERFLREARAAAAIQSDHVTRVLDIGTLHTGAPYIVLEYLTGVDLSQLLRSRGRLPIAEAVDIILQTCEAIGEAHALGIIHRDIKPQNLFVISRAGAPFVKVLDFGLAKMALEVDEAQQGSLTATSMVIGSPQYMSPEQFQSLKHVDARTDIWALGVILYQIISGRRPFEGKSMAAVCENILATTPVPLTTYRREIPLELDALVQRCMEKDPTRRVQSVAELAQRLAPFARISAGLPGEQVARALPVPPAAPQPAPSAAMALSAGSTTSTTREQTTVRIGAWIKLQRQLRPKKAVLIAAMGAVAAAVLCVLLIGWLLRLQGQQGNAAIDVATQENASPESALAEAKAATKTDQVSAPRATTAVAAALRSEPPDPRPATIVVVTRAGASASPLAEVTVVKPKTNGPASATTSQPDTCEEPQPRVKADVVDPWK